MPGWMKKNHLLNSLNVARRDGIFYNLIREDYICLWILGITFFFLTTFLNM